MQRSLTTAETSARPLQRKNAKALCLGLEASERLARENETAAAKAVHHVKEQQRLLRRLSGYISSASESGTTSSDGDHNDPPAVDAYSEGDGPPRR